MYKKLLFVLMLVGALYGSVLGQGCKCPYYNGYDKLWATAEPHAEESYVDFHFLILTTCADGDSTDGEMPYFIMFDDCHEPFNFGGHVTYYKRGCAKLCYPCWCPYPCLGVATHFLNYYTVRVRYSGHFRLTLVWRDYEYEQYEFDFPKTNESRIPDFMQPQIYSSFDEHIPSYGTIDIDESIRIKVWARWSPNPDEPDNIVDIILKSNGGDDSLVSTGRYYSTQNGWAIYETWLPTGTLRTMYNNPNSHFNIPRRDILTVYPRKTGCVTDAQTGPSSSVNIYLQKFWVEEISFTNSMSLCKEKITGTPPDTSRTEPIKQPQWKNTGKNEPVCYIRNNPLNFNAKIRTTFSPYHTFNARLKIFPDPADTNFQIDEMDLNFERFAETEINDITTTGNLPHTIGMSSITLLWAFYVSPQTRRWGVDTGPHDIYRIYDTPIHSHSSVYPINIDACLEKVCVKYSSNEDDVFEILENTSAGIHAEGYKYVPNDTTRLYSLYPDPLGIYRNESGMCYDFARYMTACSHSVGISANIRSIISGRVDSSGYARVVNWQNSSYSSNIWCRLWTIEGVGGNLDDGAYNFRYHMVTRYEDRSDTANVVSHIYDPIWNKNDDWENWYPQEFRYYFNINCDSSEPPPIEPAYYDWQNNTISLLIFPYFQIQEERDANCTHP